MYFDLEDKEMDLWDPAGSVPVAGVLIMLAVGEGNLYFSSNNSIPTVHFGCVDVHSLLYL